MGPPPPKGPPPEATLTCAPSPVKLGAPLICTLTAVAPKDVRLEVAIPDTRGSATVSRGDTAEARKPQIEALPDGKQQWTRTFSVRTVKPRDIKVPDLTLTWHEPEGGVGMMSVPGTRVPVKLITAGQIDARFRDLAQPLGRPLEAPKPSADADAGVVARVAPLSEEEAARLAGFWAAHGPAPYLITNWPLIIGLIVIAAGALGFAGAWLYQRWRARRPVEEAPWVDPRPAHVIALEALDRLEGEDLPGQGHIKAYYSRLSEIIRMYLERRFGFYALEMTTDEIRAQLPALDLSPEGRRALESFLEESDLVKFAGFAPSDSAVEIIMRAARGIVELTRAPEPGEAEGGS